MSNYWKKKLDELEKEKKNNPSGSYWDRKAVELKNEELRRKAFIKQKEEEEDDIAPIKSKEDDGKLDFFQKSSLFDDGWDFGDITKTILGSVGDAGVNAVKGVGGLVEGITDLASYGVAGVADAIGKDSFADDLRKKTQASYVDKLLKPAEDYLDKSSIFGRTSDAILQGVGQIGGIMATGGLGAAGGLGAGGVTALTTGVMGLSGMGSGMGEAYKGGATDEEAVTYGAISGAADAISELIFGGLGKAVNAVGFSRGLSSADDMLAKKVSSMFSNQIAKNLSEFGIKAGAEGFEEVLAGIAQAAGKKATYMSEEEFGKILEDENLLEQFVVGAVTSGIAQAPGLHRANKTGSDFITGLNQNEQAVVKKEIENRIAEAEADGKKLTAKEKSAIEAQVEKDLEKGYISTDLIDEIVGGETYKAYKDSVDREDALFKEYEELGKKEKPTLADQYRYGELDSRVKSIKDNDLRSKRKAHLDQFISEQVNGSRLAESYNEKARAFEDYKADYSKYEGTKHPEAARKTIESAIKAGASNTNRVHDFVDMVAKTSADTGLTFSFQSGEQIKAEFIKGKMKEIERLEAIAEPTAEQTQKLESLKDILQKVESGKIKVNGSLYNGSIVLNLDSPKVLNRTVGHEITHSLEKAKSYDALKKSLFAYAETKGIDIASEINNRKLMYEGIAKADPEAELVSDLVGDFLFNDIEYVNKLSVENRNVFQRIYDEIKHLLKLATAGSKEARQLEKVKRNMEKAYRESRAQKNTADSGVGYALSKDADGNVFVDVTEDILDVNDGESVARTIQKVIAERFHNLIDVHGQKIQINKTTNDEFRRSNSAKGVLAGSAQAYTDKLRTIANANEILAAARNWIGEATKHQRKDDIVEFARANVMYRVGENGYIADVLVGTRKNGASVLYDLVNIYEKKISEASVTMASDNRSQRRQNASDEQIVPQNGENVKYSLVEDQKTIDFLENQEHITVYKAMVLIDGKLYPPMASQEYVDEEVTLKNGKKKTKRVRKLKNPSVLGRWQKAEERPDLITKFQPPSEKYPDGYGKFDLLKSNGKSTNDVAYNPYEHTSNIVLNDQFAEAYQRPELVTVEYHIPVSELTSGYKAQYAKDSVGLTDWKAGGVAQKLKNSHRDVYLTRWSKPVRIVPDSEVAQKYKEILDKEDGISVPWNVVTPSLREELENIGVPIDYSDIKAGSTTRTFEAFMRGEYDKPAKKSKKTQYSLGYHAGDLGKSEHLGMISADRNTGHFGTGTYFVGNPDKLKGYNSRNGKPAPIETVDFDNYKLYKPATNTSGRDLHDFLKGVNSYYHRDTTLVQSVSELEQVKENIDELRYEVEELDNTPEEISLLSEARRVLGRDGVDFVVQKHLPIDVFRNGDGTFETADGKQITTLDALDMIEDFRPLNIELYNEVANGWTERKIEKYERWHRDIESNAGYLFNTSPERVNGILAEIRDEIEAGNYTYETSKGQDSASTRFMKKLGYEGIDVRHLSELDDTYYGSVIYDLKGEDAKRKTEIGTAKYSLSDSDGRELSKEQQDFFKDSKVRNENGNLMVMYHGTPNGDFTVFKEGTYFTASKEYADRYQNPGASSISTGKVASNPKTFAVYLDIKKPFDINDAEAREIYINDYIKGGNAMGINPYLSDAEYAKIRTIDWTEGEDLRDFLIENEYDYDGLVLDEGGTGGYGDDVQSRGKSYVVFSPEQVKNIDNKNPTSDPDIRFSLSEAVEETKDLMAIHNLHSSELLKQLKMGGMAYPSIAITKPGLFSHDGFGEVSVILRKDAIDPKNSKYNKIYSADAYTPTFPNVDYEASEQVAANITSKVNKLYDKLPQYYQMSLRSLRDYTNIDDQLNRWGGEQRLVEKYADDYGMKQLYLAEKGEAVPIAKKTTETRMTDYQMKLYRTVADTIGEDVLKSFNEKGSFEKLGMARMAWLEKHGDTLKNIYAEDWSSDGTMTKEEALEIANGEKPIYWKGEIDRALNFIKTGGVTVTETDDIGTTQAKIDEKIAGSDYKQWVDSLFSGIEGQSGIRNSKDIFTPSGNRRSFAQTHDPLTIDNIVKAMRKENQTGQGAFGGGSILGASAKEFGSIAEVKKNSSKLGMMDKAEHDAITDKINDTFWDIARRYANGKDIIDAQETIAEAVSKNESKAGIARYLKQYDYVYQYTDSIGDEIIELRDYIRSLPTPYFEAKPRRGVGFDEVGVFVIPNDADVKLKQELLNRGYSIAEYDPNVEGDRQKVVNQFEEYKFSLSDAGAGFTPVGRNEVYGKDLLRKTTPVQEEIAPVAENATVRESRTVEEMFPDDLAPVQQELDNLLMEQTELRQALESAMDQGDYSQVSRLTADYEAVTGRIRELQAQEDEQFSSLSDADMPPEAEAPYPGEPNEPADPFAERDIVDVGNRSVKAYQYENPEVKPFFTEAALGMLYDLRNGTKGEKIFNGDVYYQSGGEEGWMGTKRQTTADIAELLDTWNYTYDQIEKGLNAIIEDDGKENNAVSKRIEFMLNDRLMNGYTGVWGEQIPANQEYINLLNEKQITEYSKEAFDRFMATADQYAPPAEDIAPVQQKPGYVSTGSEQMKLPLYHDPNNVSPAIAEVQADGDIAPVFETESGQQAIFPDADVPKAVTRKELHASIIDKIKTKFAERGFDLDAVLKNARNLSTFATVDNIPQRVMEKALGYKEGGILADFTVNKVAQNETQGIKWLNSFTDRKNGLLAQISKRYNIKPGSKESAAAQMYAEGFYVGKNNEIISYGDRELALDFPDPVKQAQIKGLARDPRIRKIYDDTLKAINESRTRNAYPEIPRLDNYFLHFRAMNDTFSKLGLPFNPNDIRAKDLPTDLNGVTADLKPGQPFFASSMHREGKRTDFDLLGGLEQYLTSAKNQIYHIDDIQNLRALRNYIADTYGQANGLEGLDALSEEEQQDRIEQVYGSHLSTFAKFLNEEANMLAGKTALIDRGLEGIIGRRGMTFLDTLNRQVGANMVGYNISSSLTNFLSPVQAFAKSNKADFIKGMAQFASNKVQSIHGNGDGFAEQSPVMIRRKGAERFHRTFWQKMSDPGYVLMSAVDDISTEIIARAKYNELTRKGMDSQTAHFETDKWVSRLMGDRSLGQQPQLYNSKMLGIITKFQLEVRNQLDSQFYDTIQEAKVSNEDIQNGLLKNAKTAAKVGSTFFQLAVAQHLFGKAFESIAGYNPAFDIISAIIKTFGWDDDEEDEDTVLDNIEQGFFELMGDMPYVSTFTGGRIPIESALPIEELYKGKDQYGNEKSRWETLGEAAPYYLLPGGYGQIKKTVAGMDMFSDEHPIAGSYTDSGNLRFPVEDTLANRAQAAVFGQYASGNARDYFDNERSALKPKQIQEFIDVGMSIQDYWKYRDGLSGLSKLEEKINYINGLNLTTAQKNVLVNNLTDRKEAIDMADYDQYSSLEEFDYANKNPEKYAFFEEIGITYETYKNADDDAKKAYDWALENPDKYPMSKAIASDVVEYRRYTSELYDIKADKDSSGKSISGSRKEKVLDYINSLDIDYGAKLILFKNEYNADDESNQEIIDYLNGRSDISFEEEVAILRELGFTVTSDGTIYWD